jgi:hypothetical protein
MRLLVCGSRNWRDYASVKKHLALLSPDIIIHGACPTGADEMADEWARSNRVPIIPYAADWATYGKAAGPIRNKHMLEASHPDRIIAFGSGRGTDGMCRLAEKAGIPVHRIPGGPFEHLDAVWGKEKSTERRRQ